MEDALLSAESFAILSGADLIAATEEAPVYVHTTSQVEVKTANTIVIEGAVACWNGGRDASTGDAAGWSDGGDYYHAEADIFCMKLNNNGEIDAEPCVPAAVAIDETNNTTTITCLADGTDGAADLDVGDIVLVDYYTKKTAKTQQIEITADTFGGNYYLEADTLFRRESDGVDMPAIFVIPNCKIQSNFTFSMASSGDPSEQMRAAA